MRCHKAAPAVGPGAGPGTVAAAGAMSDRFDSAAWRRKIIEPVGQHGRAGRQDWLPGCLVACLVVVCRLSTVDCRGQIETKARQLPGLQHVRAYNFCQIRIFMRLAAQALAAKARRGRAEGARISA